MRKVKYMSFPFVLLLAACVSVSDVVPAGKDTWMVAGTNSRIGADSTMKTDLYKTASDFCAAKNKAFTPVSQNYTSIVIGRPASAELVFRCLSESDPEYKRPNMEAVYPKSRIEIENK